MNPTVDRYQNELAGTCSHLKQLSYEDDAKTLDQIIKLINGLESSLNELEAKMQFEVEDMIEEANYACYTLLPAMNQVRHYADELEGWVADDLWPLPTYQEMLFIK